MHLTIVILNKELWTLVSKISENIGRLFISKKHAKMSEEINEFSSNLVIYEDIDPKYFFNKELSKKAFEYYSSNKDITSLNSLGHMYQHGIYVEKNYEKMKEYYTLASEQGSSEALFNLGVMYDMGLGVPQDYKKAFEYYSLASEQGSSNALNNLGYMYDMGLGVPQDYKKAFEYYSLASEKGSSDSLHNLAYMYECGLYVEKDINKAINYYKLSSLKNSESINSLAVLYEDMMDYGKALYYYNDASHKGNSLSQIRLGLAYNYGKLGLSRDIDRAIYYYKLAAEQGSSDALNNLKKLGYSSKRLDIKDLSFNSDDICCICLETFSNNNKSIMILQCTHKFHYCCLKNNNNELCPLCRY
jgi:TPR repeat protein